MAEKKMKKTIPVILCILLTLIMTVAAAENERIIRFEMVRSTDTPSRHYEVFLLEDGYYLSLYDGAAQPLDMRTAEELQKMIETYGILSLDGFEGNNPYVLDGEMFFLDISFEDGTSVHASGNNAFPDGWHETAGAIEDLLLGVPYERNAGICGTYIYGEDSVLVLRENETYVFRDGTEGDWFREGPRIYLTERNDGKWYSNTFIALENALVYIQEDADGFPGTELPDGARLTKTETEASD